jgi:aryl carrier-like protein
MNTESKITDPNNLVLQLITIRLLSDYELFRKNNPNIDFAEFSARKILQVFSSLPA